LTHDEIEATLATLEQQAADFLASDIEERIQAEANSAIEGFNLWNTEQRTTIGRQQAELENEHRSIDADQLELKALIAEIQQAQVDTTDAVAVAHHNQRVADTEQRMEQHAARVDAFNQQQQALGETIQQYNQAASERAELAERAQDRAQSKMSVANAWFEQEGPAELWRQLRKLRAQLAILARKSPQAGTPALHQRLEQLRIVVQEWAAARQAANPHGLVLSDAVLHSGEGRCSAGCQMIVDTAASTATITREMVDILGIGDLVGEEVVLNLPNAIRIKAPTVLIPAIEVQGRRAEWVKGVVLDESIPGLEGSLGMSFLSRFSYQIQDRTLQLKEREGTESGPMYDVFICHKSEDRKVSRAVYDLLTERGLRVFFSPVTIPELGDADFQRVIDRALEETTHMILVCTSRQAIESPWVASEWRTFVNMILSSRKRGNLVNLLCPGMNPGTLPVTLARFQCIIQGEAGWQDELTRFLPRSS
jgi:hypothetical protein